MLPQIFWSPGKTLATLEKETIAIAYSFYKNNKTQTAKALGISIRTLDAKLKDIEADKEKDNVAFEQRKQERAEFLKRSRGEHPVINHYDTAATPRPNYDKGG